MRRQGPAQRRQRRDGALRRGPGKARIDLRCGPANDSGKPVAARITVNAFSTWTPAGERRILRESDFKTETIVANGAGGLLAAGQDFDQARASSFEADRRRKARRLGDPRRSGGLAPARCQIEEARRRPRSRSRSRAPERSRSRSTSATPSGYELNGAKPRRANKAGVASFDLGDLYGRIHLLRRRRRLRRSLLGRRAADLQALTPEPERADCRQRRHQRHHHQHPPRGGDQQGADRGDRRGRSSPHQRLPAAAPGERTEAEQIRRPRAPSAAPPRAALRITSRGPCDQMRPILVADEAGRFERLFGDVVPELFAAHPRQRLVAFQIWGSGARARPARICSRRSRRASAGAKILGVAGDDFVADLFRVPVRGQVGPGEEHLAAAGRDRHEAVERDRVADRPGSDEEDDAGEQDLRPARARAATLGGRCGRRPPTPAAGRPPSTRAAPSPWRRAAPRAAASARGRLGRPTRASPVPSRTAASPPAARPSASPGTRAGPGRWRRRRRRSVRAPGPDRRRPIR